MNPYSELYQMMGEATNIPTTILLGKVKSTLPNIEIEVGDIVIDKDNGLYIDKWIIDRNSNLKTENKGHAHGGDTTGDGSHNHDVKEPIYNKLETGDNVVVLRLGNSFIVTNKVVKI